MPPPPADPRRAAPRPVDPRPADPRQVGPGPVDPRTVDPRPVVLARGDSGHGELVLRRRGTVLELIVDGVFAMDSAHTGTEVALAELALYRLGRRARADRRADPSGWRVLVGGLGLGFTTAAVLADARVGAVDVVELQPLLPQWLRAGLVPDGVDVLADPRVRVRTGDVRDVVTGLPEAGLDAVLLDVDNGPLFLVHPANADVYRAAFLRSALLALAPGGVLAIWSADPVPALTEALAAAGGVRVEEVPLDVERDGHRFRYAVYLAERP